MTTAHADYAECTKHELINCGACKRGLPQRSTHNVQRPNQEVGTSTAAELAIICRLAGLPSIHAATTTAQRRLMDALIDRLDLPVDRHLSMPEIAEQVAMLADLRWDVLCDRRTAPSSPSPTLTLHGLVTLRRAVSAIVA